MLLRKTDFTAGIVPRTNPRPPNRIASRPNIFLYFCPKRTLKYYRSFVRRVLRGPLKIITPRDNCCCCCCCSSLYRPVNIRTRFMSVRTTRRVSYRRQARRIRRTPRPASVPSVRHDVSTEQCFLEENYYRVVLFRDSCDFFSYDNFLVDTKISTYSSRKRSPL